MKIKKITLKKRWEQLYLETTSNFLPLLAELEQHADNIEDLADNKFKKGKDHVLFGELALLCRGQKMLFDICQNHALAFYGLREYLSEYGDVIDQLSENLELLAKNPTDKTLADQIIKQMVSLRGDLDKQGEKIKDARNEIEGIDKHWDDLFKNWSKRRDGKKDG